MNEHSFVDAIHRRLSGDVHRWKINARFVKGVPDAWYSGPGGDVWVEYKYLPNQPKRSTNIGLSANQIHWLNHRYNEGRVVAVIVGTPKGAYVLTDQQWADRLNPTVTEQTDYKGAALWIEHQTLSTCLTTPSTNQCDASPASPDSRT